MKISLRPEIKWLEGIEQDDSLECGLAVAGNIALFERVTKAGKLFVDEKKFCQNAIFPSNATTLTRQ